MTALRTLAAVRAWCSACGGRPLFLDVGASCRYRWWSRWLGRRRRPSWRLRWCLSSSIRSVLCILFCWGDDMFFLLIPRNKYGLFRPFFMSKWSTYQIKYESRLSTDGTPWGSIGDNESPGLITWLQPLPFWSNICILYIEIPNRTGGWTGQFIIGGPIILFLCSNCFQTTSAIWITIHIFIFHT